MPQVRRITTKEDLLNFDWGSCTVPVLVTAEAIDKDSTQFFTDQSADGYKFLKQLQTDFETDVAKSGQPMRGVSALEGDMGGKVAAFLGIFAPSTRMSLDVDGKDAKKPLQDALLPTCSCMSPGRAFSQAERHHFATLRWSWSGTRQVALTKEESFVKFAQAAQSTASSVVPLAQLWNGWRETTSDQMQGYLSKQGQNTTFSATVAPNELLYTPPAYMVCERGQMLSIKRE